MASELLNIHLLLWNV